MKKLIAKIRAILRNRKTRKMWMRVISAAASIVVFITTYALVLPAITMESMADCGIEEHQHDDSCYEMRLVCGQEESEEHHHTDTCYEKTLVCTKEVHTHLVDCYNSSQLYSDADAVESNVYGDFVFSEESDSAGEENTAEEAVNSADSLEESDPAADSDPAISEDISDTDFTETGGNLNTDFGAEEVTSSDEQSSAADESSESGTEQPSATDESSESGTEQPSTADKSSTSDTDQPSAADESITFGTEQSSAADESTASGTEQPSIADESSASGTDQSSTADESSFFTSEGATATDALSADENAENGEIVSEDGGMEAADSGLTSDAETDPVQFGDGTLEAEGTDYKITLNYTADAQIPAGAYLRVKEITRESDEEAYLSCLEQAEQHMADSGEAGAGVDADASRFFDIEIVVDEEAAESSSSGDSGDDGENADESSGIGSVRKIEPAAPVSVNIRIMDMADAESEETQQSDPTVLHFAEDGVEQVEAAASVEEIPAETGNTDSGAASDTSVGSGEAKDIQFEADSFSVYGVVYTITKTVISAEGETYEISVTYGDDARIPEGAELQVRDILPEDEEYSDLCDKTEEALSAETGRSLSVPAVFDISILKDGSEIEPAEGSTVSVEIRVAGEYFDEAGSQKESNTDEKESEQEADISIGNSTVSSQENDDSAQENADAPQENDDSAKETGTTSQDSTGFIYYNGMMIGAGQETETDSNDVQDAATDDGNAAAAEPAFDVIHVSDDGEADVINIGEVGKDDDENRYVISFDTDSFSAYIVNGDTSNNKYYYLSALPTTMYVGDTVYLYYENTWDEGNQTVNGNNGVATVYTPVSGNNRFREVRIEKTGKFWIGSKEITVLAKQEGSHPDQVSTLANSSIGVSMNMFDYDLDDSLDSHFNQFGNSILPYQSTYNSDGINNRHLFKFWGSGIGTWGANTNNNANVTLAYNQYNDGATTNIVKTALNGGYPELYGGEETLQYLFEPSDGTDKKAYAGVDGLFQRDEYGYYYYDSDQNYAWLNTDSTSDNYKKFEVYDGTYTQWSNSDVSAAGGSDNGKAIGFFPFHEWNENYDLFVNWDKNLNHHFGLSMDLTFSFPDKTEQAMLDRNGNPIVFEFSGDDDMWVFVDGKLCMDIGGIHQPVDGTIDFTNKKVEVTYNGNTSTQTTFSSTDFENLFDGNVHTLKVFYIERGGCDSNCKIKFNLTRYTDVDFDKVDQDDTTIGLEGAQFQLYELIEYTEDGVTKTKEVPAYWYSTSGVKTPFIETSNSSGHVQFKNVPVGNYVMKEIAAPADYMLPSEDRYLTVYLDQGDVKYTISGEDADTARDYVQIPNKKPVPIELSVNKTWLDENGNQILDTSAYSATFTAKRTRSWTETTDPEPLPTSTINIGYYGYVYRQGRDVYTTTSDSYTYVAGSKVIIPYTYHSNYTGYYDTKGYCIGQDGEMVELDSSGSIELTMPDENEEITIYFYDGWRANGANYYSTDRACTVGTLSGTEADNDNLEPVTIYHTNEEDPDFSCSLTLSGGAATGTFDSGLYSGTDDAGKFPISETIDGITYTYKYYITESPVDGFTSTSGESYSTDEDFTEYFVNRKILNNVDVDGQPDYLKTLTPNLTEAGDWDGTYTLSLDVTGKAVSAEASMSLPADIVLVLDLSSSMVDNTVTVDGVEKTRFEVEKEAVQNFGYDLLAINDTNPDSIRLTVLTFGNVANSPVIEKATDKDTFNTTIANMSAPSTGVGGLTAGGQGTNWEAALQQAAAVTMRDSAEKFVVFISDGLPTLRMTADDPDTMETWLYGKIGAYGPGADTTEGTWYTYQSVVNNRVLKCCDNAKDEANTIVNDGKHFYAISVFETVKTRIDENGDGGVDCMDRLMSYAYKDSDSGTYPSENYQVAEDAVTLSNIFSGLFQTASKAVNFQNVKISDTLSSVTSTSLTFDGHASDFTYYKNYNDGSGDIPWTEDVPQASYEDGTINWDLSSAEEDGYLKDGVTYKVCFKVWPNQRAYDAILRLNEADSDEEIQIILAEYSDVAANLVKDPDTGKYRIYSNEEATLKYQKAVSTDGGDPVLEPETTLYYPRPTMETLQYEMKVAKIWNDSLYTNNRLGTVTFKIYEDGQLYKTVTLDASKVSASDPNRWEDTITVSPGIISDQIVEGETLNAGHKYTVVEEGLDYHYEFDSETITPMLTNGVMSYSGDTDGDISLTGTNDMRGSVTITKTVVDEDGNVITDESSLPEDDFTFRIYLKNLQGTAITEKTSEDEDAIWYKRLDDSGNETGTASVINSGDEFTLQAGHSLRLINVPIGTLYKVEEVTSSNPAGYTWDSTAYTYVDADHAAATDQAESADYAGYYEASANTWHYVTVTNKKVEEVNVSFDILKVAMGTEKTLEGASFTIQAVEEQSTTSSVTVSGDVTAGDPAVTADDGKTSFTDIGAGCYEVKEVDTPDGYILTGEGTFYIKVSSTGIKLLEKEITDGKLSFVESEKTTIGNVTLMTEDGKVIFKVENEPGAELPSTGGPGTRLFTILGTMLITAAAAGLMISGRTKY